MIVNEWVYGKHIYLFVISARASAIPFPPAALLPAPPFLPLDDLPFKLDPSTFPLRVRYRLPSWDDLFNLVFVFFASKDLPPSAGGGGGPAPFPGRAMGGGGGGAAPFASGVGGGVGGPAAVDPGAIGGGGGGGVGATFIDPGALGGGGGGSLAGAAFDGVNIGGGAATVGCNVGSDSGTANVGGSGGDVNVGSGEGGVTAAFGCNLGSDGSSGGEDGGDLTLDFNVGSDGSGVGGGGGGGTSIVVARFGDDVGCEGGGNNTSVVSAAKVSGAEVGMPLSSQFLLSIIPFPISFSFKLGFGTSAVSSPALLHLFSSSDAAIDFLGLLSTSVPLDGSSLNVLLLSEAPLFEK